MYTHPILPEHSGQTLLYSRVPTSQNGIKRYDRNRPRSGRSPDQETLVAARDGDVAAINQLVTWVYQEGLNYFESRVYRESLLSHSDAQDLAGESVLEFRKALPRIQALPRYVRRMFRNNLIRHLSRKRARGMRECLGEDQVGDRDYLDSAITFQPSELNHWTDQDALRFSTAMNRLSASDPITRRIWSYRLADEPLAYKQIGNILEMEDAALRMRIARFCRTVRDDVNRNEKRIRLGRKSLLRSV